MKITVLKSSVEAALAPIPKMVSAAKLPGDFNATLTIQSDKQRITIGCPLPDQHMSVVLPDAVFDEKNSSFDVNLEMFRRLIATSKGSRLSIEQDAAHVVLNCDENIEDQIATAKRMFEVMNKEWIDYWNIQSVAEPFKVEIPGLSKPLIGELDMVISEQTPFDDENGKGSDTIVDFKTAARMWSDDRAEKNLQATVFSYAFEKVHQRRPSFRFDVVTKAKTPTVRHFRTSRDDDSYKRMEKLFLMTDKGIQAGVFLPSEGSFACSDCPYADRCSGWHCNSVHTENPNAPERNQPQT